MNSVVLYIYHKPGADLYFKNVANNIDNLFKIKEAMVYDVSLAGVAFFGEPAFSSIIIRKLIL